MRLPVVCAALVVFAVGSATSPKPQTREAKRTGTFSNLRYIPEAGDLLGEEVRIVYTRSGWQGTVQLAEGVPYELIVVACEFKGDSLTFAIDHGEDQGVFRGVVGSRDLRGIMSFGPGAQEHWVLPRKKSYWE